MQIEARNLSFRYRENTPWILKDVSLKIEEGERVGLVGPSGYGKSTLVKILAGYLKPTKGEVLLDGKPLPKKGVSPVQLIYQHPEKAINPRWKMKKVLQESGMFRDEVMDALGIERDWLERYPRELSGGMRQRVMIAMALACNPRLLIADEPTTALDATTQAHILDLMKKIQEEKGMSILMITHDLGVVAEMCTRAIVMYAGEIVEEAPIDELFNAPQHPYTKGLIASVPKLGSGVKVLPSIPGSVPDLSSLPSGCRFAPRCKYATEKCRAGKPELFEVGENHYSRCWLASEDRKGEK